MDAIVLAAGFGTRLAGSCPKPLTPVAGVPLLDRVLEGLTGAGIDRVFVVTGHEADAIERHLAGRWAERAIAVRNPRPELANGVSVLAARDRVESPFVVAMADHVVAPEIWRQACAHVPPEGSATLLVDRRVDAVFDLDDATRVRTRGGRVERIGKALTEFDAVDTGVFVATAGLLDALDDVLRQTGDASLSAGVQRLADRGRMAVLDIGTAFWQDVDTPEMLAQAEHVLSQVR